MMRVRTAAVAGIIMLAACSESPVETPAQLQRNFSANVAQQSVTGHVERDLGDFGVPIEKYSFSAVRSPDGSVNGRFEVHDVNANGTTDKITGDVTCMTILPDGKTAYVGGVITSSTNQYVTPGMEALWTVRDNGEGQTADMASDLSWGYRPGSAQAHCDTGFNFFVSPNGLSLRGNVQVRP